MIAIMYNMQDGFNQKVHPQWEAQNFGQHTAILVEAGEAASSFSYKWWKAGKDNYQNFVVEMVDIWHFVMSWDQQLTLTEFKDSLHSWNLDEIHRDWSSYVSELYNDVDLDCLPPTLTNVTKDDAITAIHKIVGESYAVRNGEDDSLDLCSAFLEAWSVTVGDIASLYKFYIGKNALNLFRQNNGYKDGTYVKIWNGEEDNVKMMEIIENMEPSPSMFEEVYNQLDTQYPR